MKEFRPFRLDTVNQCLWRRRDTGEDERVLLKPTPYAILRYLVDHAGRLVTHEEILDAVWPNTHVQPEVLKRHLLDIRNALGDDPRRPAFVETLPRRGYQFIAPVEEISIAEISESPTTTKGRIVGRDRALGDLRECCRRALERQRQIVFVTGEPGIGKTSLVDEFQRRPGFGTSLYYARGQCVEGYGGKEAYYPMLGALGALCRRPGGDSIVQVLASHAPTWLLQFPALMTREQRETLHRELLGATRERMLREIGEALEIITASSPLLLILEDLQWIDPSTVDLLSALARGRAPARLMLIGTYRPMDLAHSDNPLQQVKQELLVHQLCSEIALQPLREIDVAEYMGVSVKGEEIPVGLAALVHRHSGGNPLFMEAALEHMTGRGFISSENGSWKLNVPVEEIRLGVPESLRTMIEAQIERLSVEQRRALEVACINGVAFTARVNATPANLDEDAFEELCEDLSRRQHIVRWTGSIHFPDGAVSQRYEFAHALYREVFYRSQPPGRRARLHLRIGERLEMLYAGHEGELAAELAEHFEEASDWSRAIKYLRLAADSARRRFSHKEAVAILQRAVGFVGRLLAPDGTNAEIEILQQLGVFYVAMSDDRALETYQALVALARRSGLVEVECRATLDMVFPAMRTSAQLYRETINRALELSTRLRDPLMRARVRAKCFGWRAVAGHWSREDAEICRETIDEIEGEADPLVIAEHRIQYTSLQSFSSRYRDAYTNSVDSLAVLLQQADFNRYFGPVYHIHYYLAAGTCSSGESGGRLWKRSGRQLP